MKSTNFGTTIEGLKLILEDVKDLPFVIEVLNRPQHRDVVVKITAREDVLFEFLDRNELSKCVGQIIEA